MRALVVYESLWGNTAAIARAIAAGIGDGAEALNTAEAPAEVVAEADLLVCGSPVFAFRLPTESVREGIRKNPGPAPAPPDLSHPSMRTWLDGVAPGSGAAAAFDTQAKGPWGSAAPAIAKALRRAGYRIVAKPEGFYVTGKYGPLHDGELDRAREWGAALASAV